MDDGRCAYIRVDMKTVTTTKVGFEDIEKMRQCDTFRVDPRGPGKMKDEVPLDA